jgi:hypothetical protein
MKYLFAFCGKKIDWNIFAVFIMIEYLRMDIEQWVSAPQHGQSFMSGIVRRRSKDRPGRLLPPSQIA